MTEYITCTETAKLVRAALKDAFKQKYPKVKFSVRSDMYAGGASIDIHWTDGPTRLEVEKITNKFRGAQFDSSIDMMNYHTSTLNGKQVRFGADFVQCYRKISLVHLTAVAQKYCKQYKCDLPRMEESGGCAYCPDWNNPHAEQINQLALAVAQKPERVVKKKTIKK